MRRQHSPLPSGPIPLWKDLRATSETSPLPRHRVRSMYDPRSTSRANHPTYHDHQLHIVSDLADNNDGTSTLDDNRSHPHGANVSPTAGVDARGAHHSLPAGDRDPDPRILGPIRTSGRRLGDRNRLAGIELPTRRREPHWLLLDLPDGAAIARGPVRGGRVSRLVCGTVRRTGLSSGRCVALCVLGTVTLATLIGKVL
jgi:hypothetical protein